MGLSVQQALKKFWHQAAERKNRTFLWTSLLVLLLMVSGSFQPIDHLLRLSRSTFFTHDAKPQLAVVMVDDVSSSAHGE